MKLKGNWNNETTYAIGDVVLFTDNVVYNLLHPCKAGTPPVDTRYWGRASAMRAMCAMMILDMMSEESGNNQAIIDMIPTNVSDEALLLKSSTADSEKEFLITVDDDGEITATEVTNGGGT